MPLIQGDAKDKLQSVTGCFSTPGCISRFCHAFSLASTRNADGGEFCKKRCVSCSSLDSSVAKDLKFASERGSDVASTRELQAATTMLAR